MHYRKISYRLAEHRRKNERKITAPGECVRLRSWGSEGLPKAQDALNALKWLYVSSLKVGMFKGESFQEQKMRVSELEN